MSNLLSRRRRVVGALTMVAVVAAGTVACSSSTDATDPTTTVQAGGTTETTETTGTTGTTEEPTGTSRPPGTTIDEEGGPGTSQPDPGEPDEVPTGDETAQDYADALVASFDSSPTPSSDEIFTRDVVECVSPIWVEAIGVETFQDAGIAPADIADGTSGLDDVTLDQATAGAIVDSLPACGLPLFDLFIDGLGSEVKDDPAKMACVQGAATEAQIRAILVDQIRGEQGDDPEDLVGQCLT